MPRSDKKRAKRKTQAIHPDAMVLFSKPMLCIKIQAKQNEQTEKATEEFPFILNSGRILYQYHSATMSRKNKALNDFANEAYVLMNPIDAYKHGFKTGERVKLSNTRGELETTLKEDDGVSIGELFMPWHFSEALVNKLTRAELDPYSKIAPFKLSACRVEKV